eukprot:5100838-Amphidinium_carterae.2
MSTTCLDNIVKTTQYCITNRGTPARSPATIGFRSRECITKTLRSEEHVTCIVSYGSSARRLLRETTEDRRVTSTIVWVVEFTIQVQEHEAAVVESRLENIENVENQTIEFMEIFLEALITEASNASEVLATYHYLEFVYVEPLGGIDSFQRGVGLKEAQVLGLLLEGMLGDTRSYSANVCTEKPRGLHYMTSGT